MEEVDKVMPEVVNSKSSPLNLGDRYWFVLHYIKENGQTTPQKYIEDFNKGGKSLELFAPIIRPAYSSNGKIIFRNKLLTYYYVFVKGTLKEVKELCAIPNNGLSLVLNRGSEKRYGILSETEMENFKILSRIHTNVIPFFNIEDIKLEEGDLVEVVGGEYEGLKGRFIPKSRSTKGKLVIATTADLGAVLWDIDAKYVRILEFAPSSQRPYEIIDSFISKFIPILRKFHEEERLTEKEKSLLVVFNNRMSVVQPHNSKIEAKLLATLMSVQIILGDKSGFQSSIARYEKRKGTVTNPWTKALIEMMLGVSKKDISRLRAIYECLKTIEAPLAKTQRELLSELEFYIQN